MKVLQAGIAKSGNYWIWKILSALATKSGGYASWASVQPVAQALPRESQAFPEQFAIDSIEIYGGRVYWDAQPFVRLLVSDVADFVKRSTVVWTHSVCTDPLAQLIRDVGRAIYVVRDPRSLAVSMAHFDRARFKAAHMPLPMESFDHRVEFWCWRFARSWPRHVRSFLDQDPPLPLLLVRYEDLVDNYDEEIRRVCDFLDITLAPNQLDDLREETALETMRRSAPDHVRKGSTTDWTNMLSSAQLALFSGLCAHTMKRVGYDVHAYNTDAPAVAKQGQAKAIWTPRTTDNGEDHCISLPSKGVVDLSVMPRDDALFLRRMQSLRMSETATKDRCGYVVVLNLGATSLAVSARLALPMMELVTSGSVAVSTLLEAHPAGERLSTDVDFLVQNGFRISRTHCSVASEERTGS